MLIVTAFLLIILVGLVLLYWRLESRFLKKKTSEVMREEVWGEIVAERESELAKKRHFREELDLASTSKSE